MQILPIGVSSTSPNWEMFINVFFFGKGEIHSCLHIENVTCKCSEFCYMGLNLLVAFCEYDSPRHPPPVSLMFGPGGGHRPPAKSLPHANEPCPFRLKRKDRGAYGRPAGPPLPPANVTRSCTRKHTQTRSLSTVLGFWHTHIP